MIVALRNSNVGSATIDVAARPTHNRTVREDNVHQTTSASTACGVLLLWLQRTVGVSQAKLHQISWSFVSGGALEGGGLDARRKYNPPAARRSASTVFMSNSPPSRSSRRRCPSNLCHNDNKNCGCSYKQWRGHLFLRGDEVIDRFDAEPRALWRTPIASRLGLYSWLLRRMRFPALAAAICARRFRNPCELSASASSAHAMLGLRDAGAHAQTSCRRPQCRNTAGI